MLEQGQIITVYKDPLFKTLPEGQAKLIEKRSVKEGKRGTELWLVQFLETGYTVPRIVHEDWEED